MAYQPSYDTDDSAVPEAVRIFFKRRLFELAGVVLFLVLIAAGLALASWSVDDPSLNHALDRAAKNWLGYPGAVVADELMQFFGLGVLVFLAVPVRWAVGFLSHEGMQRPLAKLFAWLGCAITASAAPESIMGRTMRITPRCCGPRSMKSPRKIARRSGWHQTPSTGE